VSKEKEREHDPSRATHSRRLDDRIRELCARLIHLKEHDDLDLILPELKAALHQSIERLRIRAAGALSGYRDFTERRKTT
jgi:hypothetical protein